MARFAVGLSLVLLFVATFSFAQSDPAMGMQLFSTNHFGIDLASSNVNLSIPVRSKIGKLPFSSMFVGNYHAFQAANSWAVTSGLAMYVSPIVNLHGTISGSCPSYKEEVTISIIDGTGASHLVPGAWIGLCNGQNGNLNNGTWVTTDGSGYTLVVTNGIPTVYDKAGVQNVMTGNLSVGYSTAWKAIDPDGATVSLDTTTGNWTDSLNTTALTQTYNGSNAFIYSYLDASGNTQSYTMTYAANKYNFASNFGCTGWPEYSGSYAPVVSVTTPTGGVYGFSYEPTPGKSGYYTGRIAKITYPSGGSISYSYSGGKNGINCTSGVVPTLTVTVNDNNGNIGTWTYVNSNGYNPSTCVAGAGPCNYTVTGTDPAGNQTVYYFSGEYQTAAWTYQGQSTGGYTGALRVTTSCYNGNLNNGLGGCQSPTSVPSLPIFQTDVYTWVGVAPQSLVETKYDSTYGLVTSVGRWDWGAPMPPTSFNLISTTYTPLGSWNGSNCAAVGNYINDRVCYKNVNDGSGALQSSETFNYSLQGHLLKHVAATTKAGVGGPAVTSQASYNSTGTVNVFTDINNAQTTYHYDGSCNSLVPTSVSAPLSLSTSMVWDCNGGVVTSSTDVNGNVTSYAHVDPLYRLTQVIYPDSSAHIDTLSYHTGSNYPWYTYWTKASTSTASVTGYSYVDGLGRPTTKETDDYSWQVTTYNKLGQVYTVSNPYLTTSDPTYGLTTYTYDALGRVTSIARPDGSSISSTYTDRAIEVSGIYGLNRVYQYNGLGELVSVCDGIGAPVQSNGATISACGQDIAANGFLAAYGYDALGHLMSVNYSGQVRSYGPFDGLGRMTSETNPETGTISYAYDTTSPGDLYQIKDARGITQTFSYDALHRITGVTFSDGTPSVSYLYDGASIWGNTLTNGKGRLTHGYVGTSATIADKGISYDSMGRVINTYSCAPLSCGHSTTHLGYTYDFLGDRTSLLDGDSGITLNYSYDTIGDLTGITSSLSDSTHPHTLLSSFSYNALRLLTQDLRADGNTETYSYDKMGRLATYTAGSLYALTLGRNTAGDVTTATDSINGTWSYAYYGVMLHKLAWSGCTANCPNGWGSYAYGYDQFGNRWQQVVNSGSGPAPSYTFTNANQISGSGVAYDASGDMTADGLGNTYSYDALHRLKSIGGSNTSEAFVYDALGDRVGANPAYQTGSQLDFVFDLNQKILHRNDAGISGGSNGWGQEVYAGSHIGLYANGHFYSEYQDQVESNRAWTTYSSGGSSTTQTCSDLPFGDAYTCVGPSPDWMFFSDKIQDGDLNEYVFPARRYSTTQGRWQVPDPAGLTAVDLTSPHTWNRYTYGMNDPVSFTDPTGLDVLTGEQDWTAYNYFSGASCDPTADATCIFQPRLPFFTSSSGQSGFSFGFGSSFDNSSFLCGESVGLPCGLPIDNSIWNILGISPPQMNCMPICDATNAAANNGQNAPPGVPKPPNPILQNCPGPASPPPTGTEQDLEGLAALSHVVDMAGVTGLGAGLMVGSPIAAGATCFYSGGLMCFAALEAAPAGTVGGYYLMKNGAQQLVALIPNKKGC
jgi:RHS repeat-associated protein